MKETPIIVPIQLTYGTSSEPTLTKTHTSILSWHLKNEATIKQQQTSEELSAEIYDYIYYDDHYTISRKPKKLTPVKLRNQLLAA